MICNRSLNFLLPAGRYCQHNSKAKAAWETQGLRELFGELLGFFGDFGP